MDGGGREAELEGMGISRDANLWRMSSILEAVRVWVSPRVD